MTLTSRASAALAALALLAAVVVGGCGGPTAQPAPSATAPPSVPAGITGTIHGLTRDADTGETVLHVVDDGAIQGAVDRATVTVTSRTTVWMPGGGTGKAADLGPGQMVSIWFDGPVAESSPLEGTATDVRILLED
ncbi:MAG TPA: DUF3221 domain-containing protein [Thermoleophilia bacterium]|nr:DUF3221 domain-containing protein [Thermoleophilia bacterium]